jgi:hypothetical protein
MKEGRGSGERDAGRCLKIVCVGVVVVALLVPRPPSRQPAVVQLALDKIWLGGMLETAVLGYDQWQVSEDTGADQVRALAGVLDSVHAAGLELGIPKWGVSLKYMHEFEARQRFQGQLVTFTFALPLDPVVDRVRGLVQ